MKEKKFQHLTNAVYPQLHPALQRKSAKVSWALNCSAFSCSPLHPLSVSETSSIASYSGAKTPGRQRVTCYRPECPNWALCGCVETLREPQLWYSTERGTWKQDEQGLKKARRAMLPLTPAVRQKTWPALKWVGKTGKTEQKTSSKPEYKFGLWLVLTFSLKHGNYSSFMISLFFLVLTYEFTTGSTMVISAPLTIQNITGSDFETQFSNINEHNHIYSF